MRYLLKQGSIIDPARRVATVGDVLVENGKVLEIFDFAEMHPDRESRVEGAEIINARGCVIAPGFTDLHAHLREPGDEQKETITTGTAAAAHGGFTTVCVMPDTHPTVDNPGMVRQIRQIARRDGHVHIEVVGALTVGREGRTLTEMHELVDAGVIAFSDEGRSVENSALMRNALAYAAVLGVPVMVHCEDAKLSAGGVMHEGAVSTRLGLPGIPAAAEEAIIARDIALAEATGVHLHICHVTTAGGLALIRAAKQRGVYVTCEVTPHHLTLTDRWVMGGLVDPSTATSKPRQRRNRAPGLSLPPWLDPTKLPPYDTSTRLNPPLRTEDDVDALIEGLRDGTIDAIATDHSPQSRVEKQCEYGLAAAGISSLETALGLVLTLVHRGEMDLVNMVARLTEGPAQVLGRAPATLRPGSRADIVIFDPERTWQVDTNYFASLAKHSPLQGQQLRGRVMLTMVDGQIVFRRGEFGKHGSSTPQASRLEGILSNEE